jgi:hypothetical protein
MAQVAPPGPVCTPLIPATMPADKVKELGKPYLFERPAQPVEEAAGMSFRRLMRAVL